MIDWGDDPGRAGARGLVATTASGAILPEGDRRLRELRAEAQQAMVQACDHCD